MYKVVILLYDVLFSFFLGLWTFYYYTRINDQSQKENGCYASTATVSPSKEATPLIRSLFHCKKGWPCKTWITVMKHVFVSGMG
jgi:hypothetical protein